MIFVHAQFRFPANRSESARAARDPLMEAIEPTRAEYGNQLYAINADLTDPDRISVVEVWADQASLEAHTQTLGAAQLLGALAEAGVTSVEITQYDVADSKTEDIVLHPGWPHSA